MMKEDKLIYAEEPAIPLNMKWHNYSYTHTEKIFRRLLSWVLFIMLYGIRKFFLQFLWCISSYLFQV
jgi:hypothetical protein